MQLDHITIRTADTEATRDFFLRVFDTLEERPRPRAIERIPGHWLFAGVDPIIHIIGSFGVGMDDGAEAWDHVGFRLGGYDIFRAKLDRLGIQYSPMELPELNERRIFLRTPFGPIIETVFREES